MRFIEPLVPGVLLGREKRFFVHVRLEDGREVVAHTNNTGSMAGCNAPGSRVWLCPADHPRRRLKWTYEIVEAAPGVLAGVNTARAQRLAEEAVAAGRVPALDGYDSLLRERSPEPGTRLDLLLEGRRGRVWVEVKNVTLVEDDRALFPDAVSARGLKHLDALRRLRAAGERAVMFFVVQRGDARAFAPAEVIDPDYAAGLRRAAAAGVEILAYAAGVGLEGISIERKLPVEL